jgi:peptidoglycan/LPS O-acetylase OafA/YrhL
MRRFQALDGLRGISAMLFHLPVAFNLFGRPLVRESYIFVDFFFVLSGFVISHAYEGRLANWSDGVQFIVRRIGRLWPLHLATLAALVLFECLLALGGQWGLDVRPAFTGEKSPALLLPNALVLHGWMPLVMSWNAPSWSISAEFLAYLVFAAVALLARRHLMAVTAGLLALAWFVSLSVAPDDAMYAGLPGLRAVCGFFAGALVQAVFAKAGRPNWSKTLGTILEIGAVIVVLAFLSISRKELIPWAMPVFAATNYIYAAERGALSHWLTSAPLQMLGRLSYSIYLTHAGLIAVWFAIVRLSGPLLGADFTTPTQSRFPWVHSVDWDLIDFGNAWVNDLCVLVFAGVVLGVSRLTWRYVEGPGQRTTAQLLTRGGASRSVSPAPAE